MIYPINHIQSVIRVGVQTERGVEEIGFDMTPWMTRWPGMTYAVWVTRPGEEASYPAADVEMVGNVLYWYPNGTDTEKEGAGRVEVVGIGEGKCKSTGVMDTLVKATTLDVTQETPETIRPWAEKVMEAAQTVKTAVDAGEGTLYLVRTTPSAGVAYYADRPFDDVVKAIEDGKTVLLAHKGKTHVCIGLENGKPTFDTGIERVGFLARQTFCHINETGKVSISTGSYFKGHTPYKLKIEHDGKTETFDGSADVNIKIEGSSIPDPGKAFQQLVSDADGKAVWQDALAYKYVKAGTMTLFAEEELMAMGDDDGDGANDLFASMTPLVAMPEVGKTYEVTLNGATYNTVARSLEEEGVQVAVILGNAHNIGSESFDNTGEPFGLMVLGRELQMQMGGASLLMVYVADAATLSIKGEGVVTTTKKIDPDLLPETRKTITIMIDADGNVMCDTPFSEVSKMTCGELQSALRIVQTGSYGGDALNKEADVQVRKRASDVLGEMLEITFRQYADPGDAAAVKEATRYIYWAANGLQLAKWNLYSLPIMDAGWGYNQQTYYLRSVGGKWEPVSIEQMKKDLGIDGGVTPAAEDVFYTADGRVFNTVDAAVLHVQKGDA